jgi:hypothetical protein
LPLGLIVASLAFEVATLDMIHAVIFVHVGLEQHVEVAPVGLTALHGASDQLGVAFGDLLI